MSTKCIISRLNNILIKNTTIKSFIRNSSYQNSKIVGNADEYTSKYEITNSPEDWKYVERILAPLVVPEPQNKTCYPSGWKPQTDKINGKYFVSRTRNYMVPVYLEITHRGMRKITNIKRIQGDIFELEKDLKEYFDNLGKTVAIQVNEFVGYIHLKGDHVNLIKEFLLSKGF